MKRILVFAAMLTALIALLPQAMTAPEPYRVPTTWELDFEFEAPQPISLLLPGQKKPTTFWYMLYSVKNLTRNPKTGVGVDQNFTPEFIMHTDTGQTVIANRRIVDRVFAAIKKRHNNPLLKRHTDMIGKILYGRDNAKDGVAIWPDFNAKTGKMDIFVGGLSGETAEMELPRPVTVTKTSVDGVVTTEVQTKVILHKSRQLTFSVKGLTGTTAYSKTKLLAKKWVLR